MNLTIGKKIALGFGLALLIVAIIGVASFQSTNQLVQASAKEKHSQKMLAELEQVATLLETLISAQRRYVITGDDLSLERFDEAVTSIGGAIEDVRRLTVEMPQYQRRLDTLDSLMAARIAFSKENIALRRESGFEAAQQHILTDKGRQLSTDIRQIIDEIENDETVLLARLAKDSTARAQLTTRIIVVSSVGALGILACAGYFITRSITRPLGQFMLFVEQVGKGDLTKKAANSTRDELGQLGHTLNQMVAGLRDVANQSRQAAENLNSASAEMLASTQQQAGSTSEQAKAVQETTATVEEISQAGTQISEKARKVATTAEATAGTSAAGLQAVQNTNRTMESIREQAEAVAENVVTLSEKTQAVGEIIATVNDIAEQSNLLALNAAIEAAAAGEQGRSFSVVANEIKNLADQAKQATVQVRSILGEIQKGINSSVMLTEEAVKRVDSGKQQAEVTEKTIRQMSDGIQESIQAFQLIVASTNQQQIGLEQVSQAMKNIRQATEQTASGTTQLEKATVNINALGQQMRKAVERYQV